MLFREEDEDLEVLPFADRAEAGRMLAGKLSAYYGRNDVIVLGLPRGGVPVAIEVAGALHLPMDIFVVRKLGVPWDPELAMGAVAEDNVQVLDLCIVKALGISEEDILKMTTAVGKEIETRQRLCRGDRPPLGVAGKIVILVDDGIATGCSILAAIAGLRRRGAAWIVVAFPIASAASYSAVRMEADELISVSELDLLIAVSQWYQDFSQVSDEDVRHMLAHRADAMRRVA
jgi:putative phosphoribosyl transferase